MSCQFSKQSSLPFNNNVSHALSPLLILFIMMYGALLPLLLRVGHVILLFLRVIFLDILEFIFSKIVMNFIKYIMTLPK